MAGLCALCGLSFEATPPTPNQPYTILRIKRKRNEEPLDALVVETVKRKKSRGLGVFQYAETVEDGVWDDAERQQGIKEKISRLAQETQQKPVVSQATVPVLSPSRDEKVRRFTVVDLDEAEPRPRSLPPKILASKDPSKQPKSAKDFKLYDAIPNEQASIIQDTTSEEIDKFLPLLNDYLKLHDIDTNDNVVTPPANQPCNDYVWDVFYHRQASLSAWNSIAANIGTVTGLPSEFEGHESQSDSDEEYPDEADEDSNAEEYYKNDYPEDEGESDEFEDSDYDRKVHYYNSDDD